MSAANLTHACPSCGAEETLDVLLHRMIDDDQSRRLLAELITVSLPLGAKVVRYLRLHKPAKQKLRLERVQEVLAELVPDIRRGAITRKGRDWQAPIELWREGLDEVFKASAAGTLRTPLQGNGYLYEVMLRLADRAEAQVEREQQHASRSRPHSTGAEALASVLQGVAAPVAAPAPSTRSAQAAPTSFTPAYTGPSAAALRIKADAEARKAARMGQITTLEADHVRGE